MHGVDLPHVFDCRQALARNPQRQRYAAAKDQQRADGLPQQLGRRYLRQCRSSGQSINGRASR